MFKFLAFPSIRAQLFDEQIALDPPRQRTLLLDAFLLVALLATFALTLINAGFYLYRPNDEDFLFILNDLGILIVLAGFAALNRRGHTHLVAVTCLIGMILAITFTFPSQDYERVFIIYAIPVLAASFLIRPHAAFVFAAFAISIYCLTAWYMGMLNHYVYLSMIALIVVAAVANMLVSLLNDTITRLGESEKKFRAFFQASSEGIILADPKGKIIEWNQAQAHIAGVPTEQALKMHLWDMLWHVTPTEDRTPDKIAHAQTKMHQVFDAKQISQLTGTQEQSIETSLGRAIAFQPERTLSK